MSLNIDLSGKIVLISGVSSGIGQGAAREFARAGAKVIGCARKAETDASIQPFLSLAQEFNTEVFYVPTDVSKKEDLQNLATKAGERWGKIDILLSNAGMNMFQGVEDCTEDDWQYNLDLNLASHWRLSKFCKPYLNKSKDACILLMTSNHAYSSIPGCFPYNVTKTAITGLVRAMAIEWAPEIRVVGVAPGFIDTAGNDTWFNSFEDADAERQRTIDLHPVKTLGTVEEVGALCVYLSSPLAQFICGTTILMDGGRAALMQDS